MNTLESLANFWANEGLKHIIPNTGDEFPEGFDVRAFLKHILNPTGRILEVGCGYGRLCQAFSSANYVGVDVNPNAIATAREKNPGYHFETVSPGAILPKVDGAFIYTVALHVSDEELERFLQPICECTSTVMIAEIMDSRWRRPGDPPVFNRDPEHYIATMSRLGYALVNWIKAPYARYHNLSGTIADSRITFHLYKSVSQHNDYKSG